MKPYLNCFSVRHAPRTITLSLGLLFTGGLYAITVEERVVERALPSQHGPYRVVEVARGLEHPWAVAWLPDGRKLVTERAGRLQLIDDSQARTISGLPQIDSDEDQLTPPEGGNQGGLLDVAVHPDYASNGWIYFTYSSPGDDDAVQGDDDRGTGTALARARLSDDESELVDLQVLYTQAPKTDPGRHYGSRIIFPGDGHVIFSIGDRGLRHPAQDLTHPAGSMIRLKEDGGAPDDNPFVGVTPGNLRPEIYSFGHRNNQGLTVHPENGEIWATDHGPLGGDLLYRVQAGRNYGWPQVTQGSEYSTGARIGIGSEAPGVEVPAHVWEGSKAPSGLTFYAGEAFPQWEGNLFAGFLLAEQVVRLELANGRVISEEVLLDGAIGRIRDVRQGPDGYLYVLTDDSDGGLFRIEPAQAVAE
jgi:aldose sugar dehydrogenase